MTDKPTTVVLKSLALQLRGENKDAYDLYYVVRNYGAGHHDVVKHLRPLMGDASAQEAMKRLEENFSSGDGVGPTRASVFMTGTKDAGVQADVGEYIRRLIRALESAS